VWVSLDIHMITHKGAFVAGLVNIVRCRENLQDTTRVSTVFKETVLEREIKNELLCIVHHAQ